MGKIIRVALVMKSNAKIQLSTTYKFIEIAGWVLLVILWMFSVATRSVSHPIVPSYNDYGRAVNDSAISAFIIPAICTVLFIGMTFINRYSHLFTFPGVVTTETERKQYGLAAGLIRVLKLFMVIVYMLIVLFDYLISLNRMKGISLWFMPTVLISLCLLIVFYILKAKKTA